MPVYVGVNGVRREVSNIEVGRNGTARHVVEGYCGVNGVARSFWDDISQIQRIEFRACKLVRFIPNTSDFMDITTSQASSYGSYSIGSNSIQVSSSCVGYGLSVEFKDYIVFSSGREKEWGMYQLCRQGHTFSISYSGNVSVTTNYTYPQGIYLLWSFGTDIGPGSFNGSASYSYTITSSTSSVLENTSKLGTGQSLYWSLEVGAGLVSGSGTQYTSLYLPSTITIDGVSIPCQFVNAL